MGETQNDSVVLSVGEGAARAAKGKLLRQAGYCVMEAATEEEARRLAGAQPVAVIIVDLPLPDEQCLAAIRLLKADPAVSAIPVLRLVTKMRHCALLSPRLGTSADMCLRRPVSPDALLAAVGTLVRAGRAVRQAERQRALLETLLTQMPVGLLVIDPSGRLLLANDRVRQVLQLEEVPEEPEARRRAIALYTASGGRADVEAFPLQHTLRTGEAVLEAERYLVREDGSRRTIRVDAYPIPGRDGTTTAAALAFTDITERRQMEESHTAALAEAQHWRTLLDAVLYQMPSGVVVVDAEGNIVLSNEEAKRISPRLRPGPVAEAFHGGPELRHPDGRQYAFTDLPMIRALRTGEAVSGEELVVSRGEEGEAVIAATAAPIHGSAGDITAAVAVLRDVTERRRALEERERQARLIETIQESVPIGLAYLDRELRFVQVNATLAKLVGRSREEAVGADCQELCPGIEDIAASLARVRDTGEPFEAREVRRALSRRPEAGLRALDITGVPVVHGGLVEGVVLAMMDVTDRVNQRERLLAAERARTELAQNLGDEIAHRVKNNLAMVSGLLQMQAISSSDTEVTAALREAVTRVRMFANIHKQMYGARAERVRLLEVLREVADSTKAVLAAREDIIVTVMGEETPVPARAATNLAVVANELLTNALKHGAPGEDGKLRVAVSLDQHGGHLHLAVWNSGHPIASDFDPRARPGMGMQLLWDVVVTGYGGELRFRPRAGGTLAEAVIDVAALNQ